MDDVSRELRWIELYRDRFEHTPVKGLAPVPGEIDIE
jgi:hypothetical protein